VLENVFRQHGPFGGVLHFAGSARVAESVREPLAYYRNNVSASTLLLEACLRENVQAFVFSSSAAVYGHPASQPIPEDAPMAPVSPYGASKAMFERILADAAEARGLRYAALRYFNAAGADPAGGLGECHDPETHLIPLALRAAAGTGPKRRSRWSWGRAPRAGPTFRRWRTCRSSCAGRGRSFSRGRRW
jgi:UDP-glucose 4-epimerase